MTVCHHCVRRMGVALVAAAAAILPNVPAAAREDSFTDPGAVLVQRDGKITGRLPAERIQLEYEALDARAEVNAALDSKGNIWAAIGYSVGGHHQDAQGFERLFFSPDGGRTWTSQPLPMTEKCHFLAFTVLGDDALVVVVAAEPHDPSWRKLVHVYRSIDLGKTWHETCQIKAPPYENVGEGFLSMTRLDDGTLLLPMARWTDRDEKRELVHSVFASRDAGDSFPTSHATFSDCHEAHVIQLRSGRLLGAFRYQRPPHPGETPDEIRALGGNPDWAHPTTGKRPKSAFKHVWIGESDDLGRTWKCFGAVRDRHGRPLLDFGEAHGQLVEAPDGRVVLVHDCRYPYERAHIRARLSHDEGRTWDPEIYYLSEGIGYPSSVALADGTLVTVTGNTMLDKSFQPIGQWRAQAIRWKLPPAEVKVREALEEEP